VAVGEIVPAVSGTSWDDFVHQRLFVPLGMKRSTTRVSSLSRFTNVAEPHEVRNGKPTPIPWLNLDNAGPAGSIVASALDMAQYTRLQLDGGAIGGRRVLSDSVARQIHAGNTIVPAGSSYAPVFADAHFIEYALGWFRQDYHGLLIVTHGGQTDGMHANLSLVPERRLGVVVLTNTVMFGYPIALSYRIIDAYLGRPTRDWSAEMRARLGYLNQTPQAPAPPAGGPAGLARAALVGRYAHPYLGEASVAIEGDQLTLSLLGHRAPLESRGGDRYAPRWTTALLSGAIPVATFERGGGDEARRLRLGRWTLERQ